MTSPITLLSKRIDTPEARELAELLMMESDLRHANRALKIAADMLPEENDLDGAAIRLSLVRDAIVQVCACFGPTEPFKLNLDEVPSVADQQWQDFYRFILDKRDTFAAHRFGPDRQCEIMAFVGEGVGPRTSHIRSSWCGFADADHGNFISFVGRVGLHVEGRIKTMTEIVNLQLAQMSSEELGALPEALITVAGSLRTSREKYRQKPTAK